jgi:hypothetical protein
MATERVSVVMKSKVAWQKQMTEDEGEGVECLAAEYSDEEPDVGLLRVPMTTLKSK